MNLNSICVSIVRVASYDLGPKYDPVGQFDRVADAGLLNVKNPKSPAELRKLYPFPPPKVKDFKVTEMSYENKTVTLQWTSVGDYEEQETGRGEHVMIVREEHCIDVYHAKHTQRR